MSLLSDKEFCEIDSAFHGEEVDKIDQIVSATFSGRELKEYVEHCIEMYRRNDLLIEMGLDPDSLTYKQKYLALLPLGEQAGLEQFAYISTDSDTMVGHQMIWMKRLIDEGFTMHNIRNIVKHHTKSNQIDENACTIDFIELMMYETGGEPSKFSRMLDGFVHCLQNINEEL